MITEAELEQLENIQMKYEKAKTEITPENYREIHEKYFHINTFAGRKEKEGLIKEHYYNLRLWLVLDQHYRRTRAMLNDHWEWMENPIPENRKMDEMLKMWEELIDRTWDFYVNPCQYRTNTDPNRHTCDKECDICISRRHWEEIINEKGHHFVDKDNTVYCISPVGQGGFGNAVYRIKLEYSDKTYECGLWCNGDCTDKVAERIPYGEILEMV